MRRSDYENVEVIGQVENRGASAVDTVEVGALFVDDAGQLIGFAWTYANNVEAGGKRTFEATSEFPASISEIAETQWFASDAGF